MNRIKAIQVISMFSLALFICSGIYGIVIGIFTQINISNLLMSQLRQEQ